ncbi:uncharacterized protein [Blastocystis hominis]|uniref:PHD-type domain-containing protein n=1 Tax=Blastocystis hominis TaxID=12968 RepID=D8M889_BLAHO|nr:uncharacterized protein [Blastocystis hominis]CBK24278.2 unnamed protein product [Blastocystis hominis]|eukprot:XP_012898326.1 uncharacterized protein [Blastocystis hominis]
MSKRPELTHEALSKFYNVGYLCEECAHFCHTNRGHDVVALGVKDNVKCDCGNRIFLQLDELGVSEEGHSFHSCYLCPGKPEWNPCNVYSHNCRERWCYCDEEERLPMVQCVKCCDWFHNDCAEKVWSETHEGQTIDLNDESIDFVCRDCEKKAGAPSASMAPSQSTFIGGGGEAGKSMETVETGETGETVEDAENEEDLEELIREKRSKNDRTGAMKLMLRYMLKKSLNQSKSSKRSIIVESDVNRATEELSRVMRRLNGLSSSVF